MTKETLYELIADVDEQYIADACIEPKKRQRRWLAPVMAAACLALALLVGMNGLFTTQPTPTDPYEPTQTPQPMTPPIHNHFNSPDELLALLQATLGSEEDYRAYTDSLSITEEINHPFSTQEGGKKLIAWLQGTALPCRKDAEQTFHALYYYTSGAIRGFQLFYDVDGLRYNLFCLDATSAPVLEGEIVGTATLAGHSFDLYEMEYGTGRRLFGNCFVGDHVLRIWINTTDVSKVDFSGFYLGDLLESFS